METTKIFEKLLGSFSSFNKAAILTAAMAMAFAGQADAASVTAYSDKTSFDAAAGTTVLEEFSAGRCCSSYTEINDTTVSGIKDGVTYSLVTPFTGQYPLIFNGGGGFSGQWLHSYTYGGNSALKVAFDNPVSAFAFDTNSFMGTGFTATINFLNGGTSIQTESGISGSAMQFFGFTSDMAIASVEIQGTGATSFNFALDNFQFGGAVPAVPLPAALPMLLAALGGFGFMARRRKTA